ncbi:glycine zipper 2TM domain-containing protein [Novosphingobium sp.]|uniref:glycine zipper 2TM domain-containing protein n=1 Tax=Novosphingobium sp. TaxID=1874826 RepID=UPI00286ADA45|nr:glycine zipper 2TM domain-containing protein [Novosphingobium sp.]
MKSRRLNLPLAAALSLVLATPAMAHPSAPPPPPGGPIDARPEWHGGPAAVPQPLAGHDAAMFEQQRADWLTECRRRQQNSGKTVGGAVIGGLVGGVVGNRVAGSGNRTVGTVVGAATGAVVGGAVGSAADRREARDYCEAYLDQYMSQGGHGYSYGYQPVVMMVPVMMVAVTGAAQQQGECKETIVTEEWISVPSRRRYVAPRPRAPQGKRVRVVPDKRVRL